MSPFYARCSPVGYVQPDGSLGFGSTAAEFTSKSEAMRAAMQAGVEAAKVQVIDGPHAEVGLAVYDGARAKAERTKKKKSRRAKK